MYQSTLWKVRNLLHELFLSLKQIDDRTSYNSSKLHVTDRLTRVKCKLQTCGGKYLNKSPPLPHHFRSCQCYYVDNPWNWVATKIEWIHPLRIMISKTWYLFLSQHKEHCPWWSRLELFRNESSSWRCHPGNQASWTKNLVEGLPWRPAHNDGILMSAFPSTESVVANGSSVQKYVPLMGSWPSPELQACIC